jgi:hypothetical protein
MSSGRELDPDLSAKERQALSRLAQRLERERPLPRPTFRGELRRRLSAQGAGRSTAAPVGAAGRWKAIAASYAAAGLLCLAVAIAGLAGAGPFAA